MELPPGLDLSMIPAGVPPVGVMPNFVNPPDLKVPTLVVLITMMVISFAAVTLRYLSNLTKTRKAGWDDVMTSVAVLFVFAYSAFTIHAIPFTRHSWDIPVSWYDATYFKVGFAWDEIGIVATLTAKLSILMLYLRVFSVETSTRWAILGTMGLTCLIYIPNLFIYVAMCIPRSGGTWNDFSIGTRCQKTFKWFLAHAVLVVVLDIIIMILPLPSLSKLHLSKKKKIGIGMIFLIALLGVLAAVITLWNRILLVTKPDFSWYVGISLICTNAENHVALIVGSTPAMASYIKKSFERPGGSSLLSFSYFRSRGWKKSNEDSLPELNLSNMSNSKGQQVDPLYNDKLAFTAYVHSKDGEQQDDAGGITRTVGVEQTSHRPRLPREMV